MKSNPYVLKVLLFVVLGVLYTIVCFYNLNSVFSTVVLSIANALSWCGVGFTIYCAVDYAKKRKAVENFNKAMEELGKMIEKEELEEMKKNLYEE